MDLQNPYYDEAKDIVSPPGNWSSGLKLMDQYLKNDGYERREEYVLEYAWAVPTYEAVETIAEHSPIVEIGAGTGYWASMVDDLGGDIIAYDNQERDNVPYAKWHMVHEGNHTEASEHADRTLMLCWPEYGTDMGKKTLDAYDGDRVVYIGESSGGCTGNDEFHERLGKNWNEIEYVDLPQYSGIHDNLHVYERLER